MKLSYYLYIDLYEANIELHHIEGETRISNIHYILGTNIIELGPFMCTCTHPDGWYTIGLF